MTVVAAGKPRFYLRSKDGTPLSVKGRTDAPARLLVDVTTWSTIKGAMTAAERVGADVAVAPYDEDRVCRELVEADRRRSAGYARASALKAEIVGAQTALGLAPYDQERDGIVVHVSVDAAQTRVDAAVAAIASETDPLVLRWLR